MRVSGVWWILRGPMLEKYVFKTMETREFEETLGIRRVKCGFGAEKIDQNYKFYKVSYVGSLDR